MNLPITPGTLWAYVGPGDGRGLRHKVVQAGTEISTFSEPIDDVKVGGFTWRGSPSIFRQYFRPVPGKKA